MKSLNERLRAIEAKLAKVAEHKKLGMVVFSTLIVADGLHGDADVIGCRPIGSADGARVDRLPGESLEALEARANPAGGWQHAVEPVFAETVRPYGERCAERQIPARAG